MTAKEIEEAEKIVPVVTVQNRSSLADRRHEETVRYCERRGIGFLPWYPMAGGKIVRGELGPGAKLAEVAARHGATASQVALAWVLGRSPMMLPIPGTSNVAHLEENVAAAELRLTFEEMEFLAS